MSGVNSERFNNDALIDNIKDNKAYETKEYCNRFSRGDIIDYNSKNYNSKETSKKAREKRNFFTMFFNRAIFNRLFGGMSNMPKKPVFERGKKNIKKVTGTSMEIAEKKVSLNDTMINDIFLFFAKKEIYKRFTKGVNKNHNADNEIKKAALLWINNDNNLLNLQNAQVIFNPTKEEDCLPKNINLDGINFNESDLLHFKKYNDEEYSKEDLRKYFKELIELFKKSGQFITLAEANDKTCRAYSIDGNVIDSHEYFTNGDERIDQQDFDNKIEEILSAA